MSPQVLRIKPATQSVEVFGELAEGGWKWHGGVVSPDGDVYCIPNNAPRVLKIDVRASRISEIGPATKSGRHRVPQDDKYKW
jgi:hypothetical protein